MELWCHGGASSANPFNSLLTNVSPSKLEALEAAFAYVSIAGAMTLKESIAQAGLPSTLLKRFFVGIHHGITEPKALEVLCSIANADVSLVSPTKKLNQEALIQRPIFHPKYLALFSKTSEDRWFVGSSNLTGAGVGPGGNFELGVMHSVSSTEASEARALLSSWKMLFDPMCIKASPVKLAQYEKIRLKFIKAFPIVLDQTDAADDLSTSKSLFIDVGAGSGIDRHQVEFNRRLATFFGPLPKKRRDLTLRKGNRVWDSRPLTPKKTTFDVDIYRLGMPTVKNNGVVIAHRAILFKRTSELDKFDFDVADVNSPKYSAWRRECNAQGHLGSTSGGRAFGYVL